MFAELLPPPLVIGCRCVAILFAALWSADQRVGPIVAVHSVLASAGACAIALLLGSALAATAALRPMCPRRTVTLLALVGLLFVPLYLVTGAWDAGFRRSRLAHADN